MATYGVDGVDGEDMGSVGVPLCDWTVGGEAVADEAGT